MHFVLRRLRFFGFGLSIARVQSVIVELELMTEIGYVEILKDWRMEMER